MGAGAQTGITAEKASIYTVTGTALPDTALWLRGATKKYLPLSIIIKSACRRYIGGRTAIYVGHIRGRPDNGPDQRKMDGEKYMKLIKALFVMRRSGLTAPQNSLIRYKAICR